MNMNRRRVIDNPDCGCVTELTKDRFARKGITEIIPEAKKPNSGDCSALEVRVRELYAMLSDANEKAEGYVKELEKANAEKAAAEKSATEAKAETQAANALAMSAKAEQAKAEERTAELEKELARVKEERDKLQAKLDEMATGKCEEVDIVSLAAAPVLVGTSCDTMSSLSGEEVVNPTPAGPPRAESAPQ